MANKDDLQGREAQCSSAQDFVAVATEALADPEDRDYARHLLQQAEVQCQFPSDY